MSPTINIKDRVISCKIVYYGPSLSGKTTNICHLHARAPEGSRSALQSVDTLGDRTLFFDHFALDLGRINDMSVRFQVYGVPGQPHYKMTRKMVLSGVDGVVFVADSSPDRLEDNVESLEDMRDLMADYGYDYDDTPLVIQYNKRDIPDATPIAALERVLNVNGCPYFAGVATEGQGVLEAFKAICAQTLGRIQENLGSHSPRHDGPTFSRGF